MSEVFGSIYAGAYDVLYHDKDYATECDLVEHIFEFYGKKDIRRVLDLGCGTGNHAIPLAKSGYDVMGVDRSASMLTHAKEKAAALGALPNLAFQQGDLRSFEVQPCFDAALMMFAVLSYHVENSDVLSTLRNARRHLRLDGLLIFDAWYGPAVLQHRPSQRVRVIPTPKGQILRVASGEVETWRHVCIVQIKIWKLESERLVEETEEIHTVRYFFPRELDLFLEMSGFSPIRLGAFPEFDRDPDESTWNVLGVARAV